jgi:Ca-activated chloride channel family protein
MLLDELDERDTVSIVTYAGSAGTALQPTPAARRNASARSSTAGAGGSTPAPRHPAGVRPGEANYDSKGVNRVILATDGDFNVGITDQASSRAISSASAARAFSCPCSASEWAITTTR